MSEKIIRHQGIVSEFSHGVARVKLMNISACGSCHAKAMCSVSEIDQKEIEVRVEEKSLAKGEHVEVLFENSLGLKALTLGYALPFIIMMVALLSTWIATGKEALSGIVAISVLVPYYFTLYLCRNKLQKTFSFRLEKLNV